MPKGNSGIKRGKTQDVTYTVERKYENGKMKMASAGFKAVYDAPPGTSVTVNYSGFGSLGTVHYKIGERGGGRKTLEIYNEAGQRKSSYALRSVSDVKKHFHGAWNITVHGRDLRAEEREHRRQERELWKNLNASWKKQQERGGKEEKK